MIWNDHSKLEGQHAFLGASNFHWINWNDETLEERYYGQFSTTIGTAVHELAKDCIKTRTKLNKNDKHLVDIVLHRAGVPKEAYNSENLLTNLIPFVNDAIGYHMDPEILLYHSMNCFGTTDAICYNEKDKILRIHDLKTGTTPAHIEQLLIYAALYCLEYHKNPQNFLTELRIYQNFQVLVDNPPPEEIEKFMCMIRSRDELIKNYIYKGVI